MKFGHTVFHDNKH